MWFVIWRKESPFFLHSATRKETCGISYGTRGSRLDFVLFVAGEGVGEKCAKSTTSIVGRVNDEFGYMENKMTCTKGSTAMAEKVEMSRG